MAVKALCYYFGLNIMDITTDEYWCSICTKKPGNSLLYEDPETNPHTIPCSKTPIFITRKKRYAGHVDYELEFKMCDEY